MCLFLESSTQGNQTGALVQLNIDLVCEAIQLCLSLWQNDTCESKKILNIPYHKLGYEKLQG